MQGFGEENPPGSNSFGNGDGISQDSVQVVKTTKFVNVANLADYLSSMSGPNCRVVVQQVEQGSEMAKQLDRALADMQQRKSSAGSDGIPVSQGVIPQHMLPVNSPVAPVQLSTQEESAVPQATQDRRVSRHEFTGAVTTSMVQSSCETFTSSNVHCGQPGELKHRVSSLLMQLKRVNITPCSSLDERGSDHVQHSTVDTYASLNENNLRLFQKDMGKSDIQESCTLSNGSQECNLKVETAASVIPQETPHVDRHPEPTFGDIGSTHANSASSFDEHVQFTPKSNFVESSVSQQLPPEIYMDNHGESRMVRRFATKGPSDPSPANKSPCGTAAMGPSLNTTTPSSQCPTRTVLTPKSGPRRKAVVVGCSYSGDSKASLRGPCNDAILFATALITHMGFEADDILLLVDTEPASVYIQQLVYLASAQTPINAPARNGNGRQKTGVIGGMIGGLIGDFLSRIPPDVELDIPEMLMLDSPGNPVSAENLPTRANILKALRWMVNGLRPGDSAVFYFSGHAVQIDDMSGWEGEGYDEALVPCDYMEHGDPSRGLIPAQQIRQLVQSVGRSSQVTVVLDTVGMQTALDPAGRSGPWRYIKGAMLRGMWPLADATGKMQRAVYDPEVWTNGNMQQQLVLPKFLPAMQVDCTSALIDGFISSNTEDKSSNSICIAAAPFDDVAVEAMFRPMSLTDRPIMRITTQGCEQVVCHGVFTYCLVATLTRDRTSKRGGITVRELVAGIQQRCQYLRGTRMPKLRQMCEATIHPAGLASLDNFFVSPWGGRLLPERARRPGVENSYKSLSAGLGAFLTVNEAWMQLHTEGRMRAAEQREKFGRMRSAVVNGSRMVTADLRQMMASQGYVSRRPSAAIMIGQVPSRQRSAAGKSWCGQPQYPHQYMAQDFNMPHHAVYSMSPMAVMNPSGQYHPMGQDYVVDQHGMMYPSHHVAQPMQREYYVAEPTAQFCGYPQQFVPGTFAQHVQHVQPPRQQQTCRSNTAALFKGSNHQPQHVGRTRTSACRPMGMKFAEPITSAMISQLPVHPGYN
ncbi:Caspase domain family protein [Babesia bovis T2Bo]|uniref:Peptidase C14 caspase domain-containing protein n=1 Tax=Babesia bovis TaxID=5865 RepID=A7AT06_BABBO|nr:Caspase domain family protein [Babesia bovis T2Bo]EDO06067.1 Caspase domain family protein [Babesia bovis T2Bo]|eukprot:XP_001609635.1 hypothetical protein [Babesia bovis T2Bo]